MPITVDRTMSGRDRVQEPPRDRRRRRRRPGSSPKADDKGRKLLCLLQNPVVGGQRDGALLRALGLPPIEKT
jgi:hypothetical protein